MKTTKPVTPVARPMSGAEKIVVALMVVVGAVGWMGARSSLATRREAGEASRQQREQEVARLADDHERLSILAGQPSSISAGGSATRYGSEPAAARSGRASTVSPAPAAVRSAAMTHLADLMGKNLLTATAATPAGGRVGGATNATPAFAISADGKLPPRFGELYGLNESQVTRLQETLTATRQQFEQLVLANTSITPTGENGYVLELRPPTEAANQLRDQFVADFRSVMGEDAYRSFAVLNGERARDDGTTTGGPTAIFAALGTEPTSVTLTRTGTAFRFNLTSGGGGRGGGTVPDLARIPPQFSPLLKLLPPEFTTPFATPGRDGQNGVGPGIGEESRVRTVAP